MLWQHHCCFRISWSDLVAEAGQGVLVTVEGDTSWALVEDAALKRIGLGRGLGSRGDLDVRGAVLEEDGALH